MEQRCKHHQAQVLDHQLMPSLLSSTQLDAPSFSFAYLQRQDLLALTF